MTTEYRKDIIDRFKAEFGHGWQKAYAKAIGVGQGTVSEMRGATLKHAAALIECLETMPKNIWPDRWIALKALHMALVQREMTKRRKEAAHEPH